MNVINAMNREEDMGERLFSSNCNLAAINKAIAGDWNEGKAAQAQRQAFSQPSSASTSQTSQPLK
jgi:hypothetical protein